ncbi:gpi1 [Candida margitis]|uniref:gpi1 n=1 Tax=Candida margitis TaxID=1775924 RepID=UPI002226CEDF|nr:gpi1 [Candida margitis]KAI5950608.1 gpi1 [Candida margitis]
MNFCDTRPLQIYFPNDLKKHFKQDAVFLLGYEVGNACIIFQCTEALHDSIDKIPDLKVVGAINHPSREYPINLNYNKASGGISCSLNPTIIYFDPPNFRNLEYFSIEPILLQSMEKPEKSTSPLGSKFDVYQPEVGISPQNTSIANEDVLEKINSIYRTRTTNLNINNSNYINLYNSLWLIFNDILLGITAYGYIEKYQNQIFNFIQSTVLEKCLYNDLVSLITWVSTENPAGFKLNTDLGKFLGDLYIWTILFWKDQVENVQIAENKAMLLTIIYKRQLEIIKSLFQLFRGKKYNVLRNRIDNLNNYETGDVFEIDQLLLGTLLFMMMIFLLPTTFAFYLTFSVIHILILMAYNLLENITIVLNFTPIFVCLLKFKNSKRLQGGIRFEYERSYRGTTFLSMSNKSLTYQEIFVNYVKLFQRSKNFRHSIVKNLLSGYMISFRYDYNLKFLYLMLPQEYTETTSIWKYVK